ncbi:histidine phosphatase family protein [Pseudomonas kielensis]|uniref:histidine phosphatase family protein n=1 Tax=Pseudomonas kielensis TaxID=2762577 RepID=UPI0022403693|nr:histidine phosphatase family protein [Pseudomonas kielensis]UZM13979.1 histidine phosphatase family protein [Pseudomonas kielensis]
MHITFIRHGQTPFNAAWLAGAARPTMPDPELTLIGENQAKQLKNWLKGRVFEAAFTSPYSRALQTARLCGLSSIIQVSTHLREDFVHECDVGSAPGHLASTFPEFDLSGVTQAWWSGEEPLAERVGRTWEMLKATPCETVAVIGHRGFFKTMLGVELENCEVVEIDWDRRRPWLYEDGRTAPIIWRPDATLYPEQG